MKVKNELAAVKYCIDECRKMFDHKDKFAFDVESSESERCYFVDVFVRGNLYFDKKAMKIIENNHSIYVRAEKGMLKLCFTLVKKGLKA